ncbi:MAG: cytochrome c551 [Bacillus sp. (in: firmicutes)]
MNKKLLALFLGTSLVLAACGGDQADDKPAGQGDSGEETTTADAGQEMELYKNNCAGCHGGNLEGAMGPALDKVGASMSKEDIERVILEGKGAMPKGVIKGDDATKVAAWLAEKE